MGQDQGLNIRELPGYSAEWRREITGAWYDPAGNQYRLVVKQITTERAGSLSIEFGGDWIEDDGTRSILNRGLHFGLPETPAESGGPIPLPSQTALAIAVLVGKNTQYWEPSTFECRVLGRLWGRFLSHLCRAYDSEVAFVPSWIGPLLGPAGDGPTEQAMAQLPQYLIDHYGCYTKAHFSASDFHMDDPQLLPWQYLCCPTEQFEAAFADGAGPGATGFLTERGQSTGVAEWSKIVSPTVRLNAALESCLLLFQVLWHGEALAILTRFVDQKEGKRICQERDIRALVQGLKPVASPPPDGVG